MELRLSKEQLELQQAVRLFAKTQVASAVPIMELHDQFPSLLIDKLSQAGFMGIQFLSNGEEQAAISFPILLRLTKYQR